MTSISSCGVDSKGRPLWKYNPLEIAFCGYSGSGKTTLIQKLIHSYFSTTNHILGYAKHDAHHFEMDREGKDTWKAMQAGASKIQITSPELHARISSKNFDFKEETLEFRSCDFVFVEGYKDSNLPKILMIDEDQKILKEFLDGRFKNVQAILFAESPLEEKIQGVPCFNRNDLSSVRILIDQFFEDQKRNTPLRALILDGGKSSRMQSPKGELRYFDKTQVEVVADLLKPLCQSMHLSRRINKGTVPQNVEVLEDLFLDMGPLGGILTALKKYPDSAWLVVANDLPFLSSEVLLNLIKKRNPFRYATCFLNVENKFPEPLCAIYEPKSYGSLLQNLGLGYSCPRKFLLNFPIQSVKLQQKHALENANTPDDFAKVQTKLMKHSNEDI